MNAATEQIKIRPKDIRIVKCPVCGKRNVSIWHVGFHRSTPASRRAARINAMRGGRPRKKAVEEENQQQPNQSTKQPVMPKTTKPQATAPAAQSENNNQPLKALYQWNNSLAKVG